MVQLLSLASFLDIRDTVKFKEVMKQYGFGPNGAIMTSLNFFAARFDKVLQLIEKNAERVRYVVIDTPGQIEVFTWSASGMIITEALVGCLHCLFFNNQLTVVGLLSNPGDLRDGHAEKPQSNYIYVKHATRVQCALSNEVAIYLLT